MWSHLRIYTQKGTEFYFQSELMIYDYKTKGYFIDLAQMQRQHRTCSAPIAK
jgi:hypothetical protein